MASEEVSAPSPQQVLMSMLFGIPVAHAVGVAAELGIFSRVAVAERSAEQIAAETGTLPDPTYRLMRGLAALGLLVESQQRNFSLSELGRWLLPETPGSFDAFARMNNAPWSSSVFANLMHPLKTGESAFRKQHGEGLFSWLARHPEREELFGHAMSTFSGMEVELVVVAYDFTTANRVVDIGGGHGMLLARILQSAPTTKGILFDQPRVLERAKSTFLSAELARRCEFVPGDFFEGVPPGGDLYVLKHVLHDWDDERALRILENVARAAAPGSRVLVVEQGLAPPGVPSPGKLMDIAMLAMLDGARERGAEEHARLMARAGLRFEREIATPGPIRLFVGGR